jgi:DNA-binding transcriptional MocR family regulator
VRTNGVLREHVRMAPAPRQRISARIAAVSESATLAVDAKAKALKAQGEDVIGFGAGEPDFPTPAHIVEAAAAACRDPRNHRYTPAAGLPELRDAIATKTARDSQFDVTAAQVLVTNGGKQAVEEAFATLLDPGDEVLLPAPYWTTYPRGGAPGRRGARRGADHTGKRLQGDRRATGEGSHAPDQSAFVCLALQPDGRCL